MPSNSEVLEEYLVSLGFRTDQLSYRKFEYGLTKVERRVLGLGAAVAGVVIAVDAAASKFAYSMRQMYFRSELAQSSVKNLTGMDYAGKQIGVGGERMADAVHSVAQAVRLNPGLQGLIESFGIRVKGRDMSDVVVDLVKALRNMPEFVGAKYAGMFGIDPDTYHQMINHMDKLQAKRRQMAAIYKEMGFNPDLKKNKDAIMEYTGELDKLEEKVKILGQAMLIHFIKPLNRITHSLEDGVDWWTKWAAGVNKVSSAFEGLDDVSFGSKLHGFQDYLAGNLLKILGQDEAGNRLIHKATHQDVGTGVRKNFTSSIGASTNYESIYRMMNAPRLGTIGDVPGKGGVIINQPTTFHVHGSNAHDTAKAVAEKQRQLQDRNRTGISNIVRNGKGSVR